jgi:MFS-type transporter involved in bile tolerance (Atg22 family)
MLKGFRVRKLLNQAMLYFLKKRLAGLLSNNLFMIDAIGSTTLIVFLVFCVLIILCIGSDGRTADLFLFFLLCDSGDLDGVDLTLFLLKGLFSFVEKQVRLLVHNRLRRTL